MKQAREQILEMHGMIEGNRFEVSFDEVAEKADAIQASVLKQLQDLKGS